MERVLGIDIGGTSIKVGLFSKEGTLEENTARFREIIERD